MVCAVYFAVEKELPLVHGNTRSAPSGAVPRFIDASSECQCRRGEGRIVMVLDIDRTLTSQEKITLAGMRAGEPA